MSIQRLTTREVWWSTIIFGLLGLAVSTPLIGCFKTERFQTEVLAVGLASALFWTFFGVTMLLVFWDRYYRYFYPPWVRYAAPFTVLLYTGLGMGMGWMALQLPGKPLLWFVVLGGVEGVFEHVLGIYVLGIVDKVPFLHGLPSLPLLVFSFFEYILYWAIVGWVALGITSLWI
jgi:hypothetical protein